MPVVHDAVGDHLTGVGDEAEAAGGAGGAIFHHHAVCDVAEPLEVPTQPVGRRLTREAPDEDLAHLHLLRARAGGAWEVFRTRERFSGQHGEGGGCGGGSFGRQGSGVLSCQSGESHTYKNKTARGPSSPHRALCLLPIASAKSCERSSKRAIVALCLVGDGAH